MNRFKNYVKISLLMLVMLVALSTAASAAAPTFSSAMATSDTNIDIVFSEAISVMGTPDWATAVTATGMTATGGSADGSTLHVTVAALDNTAYTASDLTIVWGTVKSNSSSDPNAGITGMSISDGQSPTVTITSTAIDPTNVFPIPMTATFSENVQNFVLGDIVVGNGNAASFAGGPKIYTFEVSPQGQGAVTVDIAAGVAQDNTGNNNIAAAQFSITYDTAAPTLPSVSITSNNTNSTLAKAGDLVTISFTSSETIDTPAVTIDSNNADSVTNTGGNNWTATRVMQSGDTEGIVAFTIDFSDLAGNAGITVAATTDATSVTYDETAPTVTIDPVTSPTNVTAQTITGTFTETGSGIATIEVNGVAATIGTGTYSASDVPLTEGSNIINVNATDNASNVGTASTTIVLDTVAPVITLNGVSPVWVVVGSVYTDAGATALDNLDGDITGSIVTVNPVNTAVPDTYTVTYDVSDTAGNAAVQVTRTVNVVDLDLENSTVVAVPTTVIENGISTTTITVTAVNNMNQEVIPGASVVLTSNRAGGADIIVPASNITDSNGQAKFRVRSATPGTAKLTAIVLGKELNQKPVVTFGFDNLLHLNKGWNLVSVPRKLDDNSLSALATNKVSKIYYYDSASGGEWKSAFYNSTSGTWNGTLTTIDDGKGYWMNATASANVPVVLKSLDNPILNPPPDYPLKAGWNLIGYTSYQLNPLLTTDIDIYLLSLRNPNSGFPLWVSAYRWTGSGYEQAKPTNIGFPNVVRTEGYWLYLNSDGTLTP